MFALATILALLIAIVGLFLPVTREQAPLAPSEVSALARITKSGTLRVGYEVEVAGLETMDREGHANVRVYWRPYREDSLSCPNGER